MNKFRKIWCVILNYNSADDCARSIADLKLQQNVDCGIVVVDNASSMEDLNSLRGICERTGVVLLENPVNRGYSAGNNVGLRYAAEHGAELAMIVNPDMRFPDTEYVSALSRVFELDDKIVVAASDILNIEGWHQNPNVPDQGWRSSFDWINGLIVGNRRPPNVKYEKNGICEKLSGCCFMIRTDFLQGIGFFDEYPFLYCEEAILAAQVKRSGMKMYYLADRQAIHYHVATSKGNTLSRFRQFCRSRTYFQWHYTDDNWFLKSIAIVSWYVWSWLMIVNAKIRSLFR